MILSGPYSAYNERSYVEPEKPGALFRVLDPQNPRQARQRFGILYWVAWRRLILSFFLSSFGASFLLIGVGCMKLCDEFGRGVAFFAAGALMAIPGFYAAVVLLGYLRGWRGYSYEMLPSYD